MINGFITLRWLLLSACFIFMVSLVGCATVPPQKDIAASVDDDPITIGDIEYSLQIEHRREGLSKTKSVNISEYVQKVIDERLLVHEAKRMNLDHKPGLIEKVDAFILRESVSRLYDDEVLSQVQVSDDEILKHYQKEYEQYTLSSIETDRLEDAVAMLEMIKEEPDFQELADKHSSHEFRSFMIDETYSRKDLNAEIKDIIDDLEPGVISDVFEGGHKYYIVKLIKRHDAPEEEMEAVREDILGAVKKIKVQNRSDEYLEYLNRKMKPEVNQEILASIPQKRNREEHVEWLKDTRTLVKLRESTLTVGEFVRTLRPGKEKSKEIIIKQWIDRKAVDYEALDRKYHINSDLKDHAVRYKNKLLVKLFIKNELSSSINISEEELLDYYQNNQEEFYRPVRYKLQQITSKTPDEAEEIKKDLMKGADFSWIARNKSYDNYSSVGGMLGWRIKDQLPVELKKTIEGLEPGEISDVMESGDFFRIYRVQEKTENKVEVFDKVRPDVRRKVFNIKYGELYDSYLNKLKNEADITIYEEVVENLDRMINNSMSQK